MAAPKNILVPTDFSPPADKALEKAVALARQATARIYLLHVIDEKIQNFIVDYCLDDAVLKQLEGDSRRASLARLQKEAEATAGAGEVEIVLEVETGIPAEVILREQQRKGIDLIVIASHGRTGVLGRLLGSVADRVVKGSPCPVVVVKPEP